MEYKLDTVVRFYISTGYINSDDSEEFTLKELGFVKEDFEDYTENEIEKMISDHFDEWLSNYDIGWGVVE